MNILIIGAGAIGIAVGASLCSVGNSVDFLASKRTKAAIYCSGVYREGIFGECEAQENVIAFDNYDDLRYELYDYIIISAKTFSNAEISEKLSLHKNQIKDECKIIIMQNGIGNDEPFLENFSKDTVYNARVITGFERTAPNKSKITVHNAPVLFGSLYGAELSCMEPIAKALDKSGIQSEVSDEVGKALWAKLLYNTTLNPLGAILHCSYGELYESKSAREIMERLVRESYDVMDAVGAVTYQSNAREYIDELYNTLIPNTYAHRASTLQDIEKKQRTEIDTLNGSVVRLGKKHGINAPTHEMICLMIKAIEENY